MRAPKWGIPNRSQSSNTIRRRSWAIALSAALALSSSRCVSDFVGASKGPPPPPPPGSVRLAFGSQPSSAVAGTSIGSSIQVLIQDSAGATVTAAGIPVTASLTGGKAGAHLRGTTTVTSAGGIATFSDLSVDSAAANYTISVSANGLAGAASQAFNVRAGPPVRIGFTVQPSNTVAGDPITPSVRVSLLDSLGNATTGSATLITIDLLPDGGPFGPQLSGNQTMNTTDGAATFPDLRVSRTGTGFTLRASASGFPAVSSAPFSVLEPNDVIGLTFRIQPANAVAGRPIAPVMRVALVNSLGNTVTTGSATITLSMVVGAGTPGAALGGTLSQGTVNGEASFGDITVDSVGAGYRLFASAPGLTGDTTTVFSITAGASARLVFTAQPTNAAAGVALAPPIKVSILDAAGNVVPGATNTVALYITAGTGAPGATLGGTTSVAAVAGVATFSTISVSTAGSGYTLTAAAAGIASDVSAGFSITPGASTPASSVVVTPTTGSFASLNASQQFVAEARDAANQPIPGAPMTWTSSNTAVAVVDGSGKVTSRGNGTTTITATSGTASATAAITVQQVTASVAILPASPDTLKALGATGTFVAEARDANSQAIAGKSYSWTTDAAAVATIDASTGVVTAVTNGAANIGVAVDGFTATQPLTVRQAIAVITIAPDTMTLAAGQQQAVTAQAFDSRNNALTRPVTFAWQSARNEVSVTVDPTDSSKAIITRLSGTHDTDVVASAEGKFGIARVR